MMMMNLCILLMQQHADLVIVNQAIPMRREQSYHKSGQLQWRRICCSRMNIDNRLWQCYIGRTYGKQPKGRPEAIEELGKLGFGGKQSRKTWHYSCGLGRIQVRNDVIMAIMAIE
eukprot:scaffold585_cov161-Skeletonema_marinoi.AAC.5